MTPDDQAGPHVPADMAPELLPHASRLDEIEGWAADLEQQLAAGPATILQQQQRAADAIAGTVQGAAGSKLTQLEALRGKLAGKMQKRAGQLFGNAWTNTVNYGAIYPTTQDALYGLKTGDSFGSMGLTQPSQQPAPAPIVTTTGTPASPPQYPQPYQPPPVPVSQAPPGALGGGFVDPGEDPGFDPGPGEFPPREPPPWEPVPPGGGIIEDPTFPPEGGGGGDGGGGIIVSSSCGTVPMTLGGADCAGMYAWVQAGMPGMYPAFTFDASCYALTIPQGWCNLWGEAPGGGVLFQVLAPCGCALYVPDGGGRGMISCGPPVPGYCYVYANNQGGVITTGPPPTTPAGSGPDVCVAPSQNLCGATSKPLPAAPAGMQDDRCGYLEAVHQAFQGGLPGLADAFKVMSSPMKAGEAMPTWAKWVFGATSPVLPELANRLFTWASNLNKQVSGSLDCDVAGTAALSTVHAVISILDKYLPIIPPQYRELVKQALNFGCTYLLPHGSEADQAYLKDAIDKKTWECWHKAAGDLIPPAEHVMYAQRQKPTAREADLLWRRELMSDQESTTRMRGDGVLDPVDEFLIRRLNDFQPSPTQLIHYMGKDAFDKDAIDKFQLSEGFNSKWTDRAKQLGKAVGMNDEVAYLEWVSHWQNVGTTTMFEALRRLRPGEGHGPLTTDKDDVRQSLLQQDYHPYWVDRMIALSYKTVGRIDSRRMYALHTIDEEQLSKYYQDEGYTEENAKRLVKYNREQRRVSELKASGLPSVRNMVNAYARGEAGLSDLMEVAQQLLPEPEQLDTAMQAADLARDLVNRRQQIAGIKRQYVNGMIGDDQTREILFGIGVDPDEVQAFLFTWKILMQKKGKEPSAAQLCKWRYYGIITAAQQTTALVNVGWAPADALRIVKECEREIAEKEAKAAAKAAQDAAKQVKAAEKAATAARKKALDEAKAFARTNGRNGTLNGAHP